MRNNIKIFGLSDSVSYAKDVCRHLGIRLSEHEETNFEDGECYIRSKENVRGSDVFIICSLYNSDKERLADKVMKLLYFTGSLRDASAGRITLVFPYMAYQRQDRKNKSRAPIYTKYFPMILESVRQPGDRILAIDPHNLSAFQSGNRFVNDHIETKNLICDWLSTQIAVERIHPKDIVVLSPDEGGVKRARFFRDALSNRLNHVLDIAYVDKTHENDGTIEANEIIGKIADKKVIIFDDMLSSVKTMREATDATEKAGGNVYAACASHGLFVGNANDHTQYLISKKVKVVVTDTVEPYRLKDEIRSQLKVISTTKLVAESIRRIHHEESISDLIN